MLTVEENKRITRTGPGTPMGELWRRFWTPFALAEELPEPDCPPIRVTLLSEALIAFRTTSGKIGLVGNHARIEALPSSSVAMRTTTMGSIGSGSGRAL